MIPFLLRPPSLLFEDPFTRAVPTTGSDSGEGMPQEGSTDVSQRNIENAVVPSHRHSSQDIFDSAFWPSFSRVGLLPFSRGGPASALLAPRLDLVEEADRFKLSVEVAGISKDQLKVTIDDAAKRLTISGEIKSESSSRRSNARKSGSSSEDTTEKSSTDAAAAQVSPTQHNGGGGQQPLISERVYGSFRRSLVLPDTADLEHIQASFNTAKAGILDVIVPKKPEKQAKERSIEVTSGVESRPERTTPNPVSTS